MKFRPLHDRVLVKQDDAEEVTSGGIIIPESAQGDREKSLTGKVVAVGAGAIDSDGNRMPMDVKKGDRVLYGKWSGKDVTIDGKDLKIVKESEIEGILG